MNGINTDPHDSGHGVAAEPDRVSIRVVVRSAVVLAVFSVVALVVVWGLFRFLEARTR
jgi:hypothetical protein